MGPRATVVAGLLGGVATAIALLLAAVVLLPDPGLPAGGSASPSASSGTPSSLLPVGTPPAEGTPVTTPSLQATIGGQAFHVGEAAPPLSVAQLGGGRVDLVNLKGRPVWVDFMQTTCQSCADEVSIMNDFAVRYAGSGLVVVAIDVREDVGTVASFVRSMNANFPIGLDTDGAAAKAWGAVVLPVHFWLDRDGIIRAAAFGGLTRDVLAAKLGTILPGVQVTP